MREYEAYLLDADGHIVLAHPIVALSDDDAIASARGLVNHHDVEVWDGARKIARLHDAESRNQPVECKPNKLGF